MKKRLHLFFFFLFLLLNVAPLFGNNYSDDFSSATIRPTWNCQDNTFLSIAQSNGLLNVTMNNVGPKVNGFGIDASASPINISQDPRIAITLKSAISFELSLGLFTLIGTTTNYNGSEIVSQVVTGDGQFHTYYFDFTDYTRDLWLGVVPVDLTNIDFLYFYMNLNTVSISGTFAVEEVKMGNDVPALGRGLSEDYTSIGSLTNWTGPSGIYDISLNGDLLVQANKASNDLSTFSKTFAPLVLEHNPFIQLYLKSDSAFLLGVQLVDGNGVTTGVKLVNYSPVAESTLMTFDFTRELRMPTDTTPNANDIVEVRFIVNPDNSAFTGEIEIQKLLLGKNAKPIGYEFPLDVPVAPTNMYLPSFAQVAQTADGIKFTVGAAPGNLYRALNHWIPSGINLKDNPYVTIKVRASQAVTLRLDLADSLGNGTNASPIIKSLAGGSAYQIITYDFTDHFSQSYPSAGTVDPTNIRRLLYFPEPGGSSFNGTLEFAFIRFGTKADQPVKPVTISTRKPIKINQLGYFPGEKKTAVVTATAGTTFKILDATNQVVYQGLLFSTKYYTPSQENVKTADFTLFDQTGNFKICIPGYDTSYTFSISSNAMDQVSKDVVKAFYYQRTGLNIIEPFAQGWTRAEGHPDTIVFIHPSAATTQRPTGTIISSPKGWYDAGDYNKYIVNSSVACYDLLAVYERYSTYFQNRDLNIPETGNTIPDILDEVKYNLDWMLTMQDLDGGVYHKLSSPNFNSVFTPPSSDHSARYVVMKTTPASLDFAAVMAQAYRIYTRFPETKDFADQCLVASVKAYVWAKAHNNIAYDQNAMNTQYNPDILTGEYAETYATSFFADEFFWAATEIAIATQEPDIISDIHFNTAYLRVMDWPNVYGYGLLSLSLYGQLFSDQTIKTTAVNSLVTLSDLLETTYQNSAYKNSMRIEDFIWGSNTYAANEVMLLTEAYYQTNQTKYLEAAIGSMDYILGKNPTGYSYISGAGEHSSSNLYMAVGLSNSNTNQIPGFMAGGPNKETTDPCAYEYNLLALKYLDSDCSYSTNEIAINWNASVSFASNALNAIMNGYSPVADVFEQGVSTGTKKPQQLTDVNIYPNPSEDVINVKIPVAGAVLQIMGVNGQILKTANLSSFENKISLEGLLPGIYVLKILSDKGVWTGKLVAGERN